MRENPRWLDSSFVFLVLVQTDAYEIIVLRGKLLSSRSSTPPALCVIYCLLQASHSDTLINAGAASDRIPEKGGEEEHKVISKPVICLAVQPRRSLLLPAVAKAGKVDGLLPKIFPVLFKNWF